jgi:hypothetical protein
VNCTCCFAGKREGPLCAVCEHHWKVYDLYIEIGNTHLEFHKTTWKAIGERLSARKRNFLRRSS